MAISKAQSFAPAVVEMAVWARALSHPARIAILQVLAARGTCICGEIVDELPLAQATVSQHLKALKKAGLVLGTIDGPRSCYCLDRGALNRAREALETLFTDLDRHPGCC